MEQTTALAESMGLSWDQISPWCWWIAVNMMYSDYGGVAIHYGVSTAEFFAELAQAFLFGDCVLDCVHTSPYNRFYPSLTAS